MDPRRGGARLVESCVIHAEAARVNPAHFSEENPSVETFAEPSVRIVLQDRRTTIYAYGGERLADIFDLPIDPRAFFMCCKKALCGTCLVQVVSGLENLSPPTEAEIETMGRLLIDDPKARLACQARVWGDCILRSYRAPCPQLAT